MDDSDDLVDLLAHHVDDAHIFALQVEPGQKYCIVYSDTVAVQNLLVNDGL